MDLIVNLASSFEVEYSTLSTFTAVLSKPIYM